MELCGISEQNQQIEREIIEKLFACIDANKSMVFNSGAGAGKTYALIECLKYIVNKYGKSLNDHNQHVICITYTNVAVNHIKEKLGNSDMVKVSTIHERIWSVINQYQKQLVKIHRENVKDKIAEMRNELTTSKKYSFYNEMEENRQTEFRNIMAEYRDDFVQAYTLGAKEFRERMPKELDNFPDIMKNVGNFKNAVNMIYRLERFEVCLQKIDNGEYRKIEYKAMYNQDRLERMRISHNTVLDYGLLMVEQYPVLRQIIIDQFPYFLIDEYQDTSEKVVRIMDVLDQYAKEIQHDIFVGYFGDMVQNIYTDGVGKNLKELHHDLEEIKKQFNRRSFQEIITVANRIRKDEIEQESVYENCTGGTVKFYSGTEEDIDRFIDFYAGEWQIDKEHPLHCFFTTNKMVAKYSGFSHFYESFEKTEHYSGVNYTQLNTELLSDEPIKLGVVPRLLFRLIHLYIVLQQEQTPLRQILLIEEMYDIDIANLRALITVLQERDGKTLDELLQSIFSVYNNQQNAKYCQLMNIVFDIEDEVSYMGVKKYIQENLFENEKDEDIIVEGMDRLLSTSIEELEQWYYYISQKKNQKKERVYHTYHGTKGLEFDNVLIVMGRGFGREKNYFEKFFKMYGAEIQEQELQSYESARNLLYVAATRAIKNLCILYVDDVRPIEKNIRKLFGDIDKVDNIIRGDNE